MGYTPHFKVKLLRVCFLLEIEQIGSQVTKVMKAVCARRRQWVRAAMHSKRCVGFVVLTEETSKELVDRLRPTFDAITSVENFWCHTILEDVVARNGSMDPLVTYVAEAWQKLREWNDPKNFGDRKMTEPVIIGDMQDFDRSTAVKVGIKGQRVGKETKNPNES